MIKWTLALTGALLAHSVLYFLFIKPEPLRYVERWTEPTITPSVRAPSAKQSAPRGSLLRSARNEERVAPSAPAAGSLSIEAVAGMGNRLPVYPEEAAANGWEGVVELALSLDDKGTIRDVKIARSSGYPILDRSAEDAARGWRISDRGNSTVRIPIRFALD